MDLPDANCTKASLRGFFSSPAMVQSILSAILQGIIWGGKEYIRVSSEGQFISESVIGVSSWQRIR